MGREANVGYNDFNQTDTDDSPFNAASSTADRWKRKWKELSPQGRVGATVAAVLLAAVLVRFVLPAVASVVGMGLLIVLFFAPYWAPTIVAFVRKHPDKLAIAAVNGFFGWTFIGWVIALVWALGSARNANPVVVNNVITQNHGVMSAPSTTPQLGDVLNGHRFNGATWQPIASDSSPPLPTIPPPPRPPVPPAAQ